jgi:hypothetical protein
MPGHGKRYKFNPLTGAQISEELRALGLSVTEVSRLTGVNPDRLVKWINGEEPNPPQLFASWLATMVVPGAMDAARQRGDDLRIDD